MNDKELIAELTAAVPTGRGHGELLKRAADALEARQPSVIDRDVAIDVIAGGTISVPGGYGVLHGDDAANIVDAIIGRAAVPDAVTEEIESLKDIAETHAFCADRLSIEKERADRIAREVCDRGCSYTGSPDQECSAHGRTPRELWGFIAQDVVGRDAATERAEKAEAERDAALAAVEAARKLHHKITRWGNDMYSISAESYEDDPSSYEDLDPFDLCAECYEVEKLICEECGGDAPIGHRSSWPCPTRAALDGAPEPETAPENYEPKCNGACAVHGSPVTNWPVQYGRRNRETGALHWLKGDPFDSWWHENQDRYEHVKRYTSPPLPVEGESND